VGVLRQVNMIKRGDMSLRGRTSATNDLLTVYAAIYVKSDLKKIRIMRLLVVDSDGQLVLEDSDEKTMGFYQGRVGPKKIKEVVKGHAQYELEGLGLKTEIPLTNVTLKSRIEIEEILARIKSGRYDPIKDLR